MFGLKQTAGLLTVPTETCDTSNSRFVRSSTSSGLSLFFNSVALWALRTVGV